MKYSLLEIVQDILNDMDSDNVNSIDDTIESQQVAQIVKTCYNEMMSNRNWPHQKKLIQLNASNELSRPTYMRLPVPVKEMEWVKYDCRRDWDSRPIYKTIRFHTPESFLQIVQARNLEYDNVRQINDFSGSPILIYDDRPPSMWTVFDDDWLVFDSYDKAVDDTLKKSKSQASVYVQPTWEHSDEAIPDIPEEAFAALVEEAKSTAFLALKQMPNQKAEQKANRQQRWLARKAWRVQGGITYPNFGRKSRK